MTVKYRGGVVPDTPGAGMDAAIASAFATARESMERFRVHDALAAAMDLARLANGYVEERAPWSQAKDPARSADLDETLATLARVLTALSALFEPVAPAHMGELASRLGLDSVPTLEQARTVPLGGRTVRAGAPLFPRADPSWATSAP
jgi:methionyl-tRNA synthetase